MAVKASRYLTHLRRLHEPAEPVARLLDAATGLGGKLGPVLVQLPPSFRADAGLLAEALSAFPRTVRVACEFRHESWYSPAVRDVLVEHGAALCWADRDAHWITPRWRTATWGYVRFHWGAGSPPPCYPREVLAARAADVAAAYPEDEDVFVYFNNDPLGCALRDARAFASLCREVGLSPTRVAPA
jgi:uncharacterized protein YecE (DUF72 family)